MKNDDHDRKESYDQLWRTAWGDLQRYGPVHRHTMENLVRMVSELDVRTILDVGCGSGENLAALAALQKYELTGLDISEEALALARERVSSAKLQCLDIQTAAPGERFDLVMSIQVIEHLLDDTRALQNMAAVSNKYVFVSTMQGRMRKSEFSIGHLRNYSTGELRSKLELAGLQVLQMTGWGFPFYSPLYRSLAELLPGGPPVGPVGGVRKVGARLLYQLYRLNLPRRGDVLSALAIRR